MPSRVQLRDDYDGVGLRALAKRSRDPRQIRRLLALAAVYDGMSRADAARVGGMDRQTLRDWAHRFNEEGPEGLTDRPRAGRPRQLTEAQMRALAEIVERGPDPALDGVVRWRRVDLQRVMGVSDVVCKCVMCGLVQVSNRSLSPNRISNWLSAGSHSLGAAFHRFSMFLMARNSSLLAA